MTTYYFTAVVHIEADDEEQAERLLRDALDEAVFLDYLTPGDVT